MELTWLGQAEARGREQMLEQMRRAVLQRAEQRFGILPEDIEKKVQAIGSVDPLAEMLARLPLAQSAEELVSGG